MSDTYLQTHSHGKNRVRVLKVRRLATGHEVMELTVKVVIESHADKAFTSPDNSNVVATDSIKNTVKPYP
jgi:urate oxidase